MYDTYYEMSCCCLAAILIVRNRLQKSFQSNYKYFVSKN